MANPPDGTDLLAQAIHLASNEGGISPEEIRAVLSEALSDPGFETHLRALLEAEGVSPEYQHEYLRIFAEWRRDSSAQRRSSS